MWQALAMVGIAVALGVGLARCATPELEHRTSTVVLACYSCPAAGGTWLSLGSGGATVLEPY